MQTVSIHNKILIRKMLRHHGATSRVLNKFIYQLNSQCIETAKNARKEIARVIFACTGAPVLFKLNNPYTKYHLSCRSTRIGKVRHA